MKRIIIILLTTCLLFSCAGNKAWTKQDTVREATWMALNGVDWLQTRQIALQPNRFYEYSPILGKHPSVERVNLYFTSTMLIHPVISYALPDPYRKWFQYLSIGVSSGCIINNIGVGIPLW